MIQVNCPIDYCKFNIEGLCSKAEITLKGAECLYCNDLESKNNIISKLDQLIESNFI